MFNFKFIYFALVVGVAYAVTPIPAIAACTLNGNPVPCEYPPIDQGTGCPVSFLPNPAPPAAPVNTILHRVTLNSPETTCNDGSPGVFYVRPSMGPGGWNKWLIVLEGGGTGFDPVGTLDTGMWNRWTGGSGSALDCVANASTDWIDASTGTPGRDGIVDHPEQAVFPGILDIRNTAFAFWNVVFVNYCSSDSWSGQAQGVELEDAGPWNVGGDTYQGFKADFNGHNIIKSVLDHLKDPGTWTPDAQEFHMYDLDDAWEVLIAGESAGGGGVLNNLDWIASELKHAPVHGSIGASHQPPIGVPGDAWFLDQRPPINNISDIQEGSEVRIQQVDRINGFLDESCVAALGITDKWQCQQLSSTEQHLATPHFVKQDMSDPLISGPWLPGNYQAGLLEDYTAWIAAQQPRFFAPNCGHHASLNAQEYFDHRLQLFETPIGLPIGPMIEELNYDEALRRFIDSSATGRFIYDGKVVFRFIPGPPARIARATWMSDCP